MLANSTPALLYPIPPGKNVPANQPIGVFAPDYAANTPIAFSDDLSNVPNAPDPSTLKWRWSFSDIKGYFYSQNPAHTFKKAGTYNIYAEIYLGGAWVTNPSFDSAQIHVVSSLPAHAPVARVTESSPVAYFGQSVTFDASGSTSTDGSALSYFWNFNDGTTATGVHVSHQFVISGKGFVSLTVTDATGAKGIATINIIAPKNPLQTTASTIAPGQNVTFTVPAADVQSLPGQPTNYSWDFGDGSQPPPLPSQPSVSHAFTQKGQYIVTMRETYGPGGSANADGGGIYDAVVITIAVPPTPKPLWRYYVGGAAVALGILISLAAAVRSQRRQLVLAEQQKAARELARARRVGAPARGGRGGSRRGYEDYGGGRDDDYPPPRSSRGASGGSSGRWANERRGPPRRGGRRGDRR
jgi:PKD repeat protein